MLAQSLGHNKQNKAEAHSNKMNDLLLRDIFPPHIADALREGRKVEQERHECDVKGIGQMQTFWVNHREMEPVQEPSGPDVSDHSAPIGYRGRHRSHDDHRSRSRGESSLSALTSKSRSTSGHGGRRATGTKQVSGKFRHESSLGDEAMHKKPTELKSMGDPRLRRESSFAAGPMFRSSVAISLSEPIFPKEDESVDENSKTEKECTRIEMDGGDPSLATVDLEGEEPRLRRAISDISLDDPGEIQTGPGPRRSGSDPSLHVDSQLSRPRRPPRASTSRKSELTRSSFLSTDTRQSMRVAIRRGRETALTPSRELSRQDSSRLSKLEQEGRGINIDRQQRLRHIEKLDRRVMASGCGDVVLMEEKATAAGDGQVYTERSQLVPNNEVSPTNNVESTPLGMQIREHVCTDRRSTRTSSSRSEAAMKRALKAGQRRGLQHR